MTKLKGFLVSSLTIASLLLVGTAAKADPLTITLDAPFQSGSASVFAFTAFAAATPVSSTAASLRAGANSAPLSPITRWNKPFASGVAVR